MLIENLVSLLGDKQAKTRKKAIELLLKNVDLTWPEIVKTLPVLEACFENTKENKEELALLLSKTYFHLSDYEKAVFFALQTSVIFQGQVKDLYTEKILSCIFDKATESKDEQNQNSKDVQFKQLNKENRHAALGFAVECGRIDWIEGIIRKQEDILEAAQYVQSVLNRNKHNQNTILLSLNKIVRGNLEAKQEKEKLLFFSVGILIALNDAETVALDLKTNKKRTAHSLCLYIWLNSSPFFQGKVVAELRKTISQEDDRTKMERIITGHVCNQIEASFLQKEKKVNKKTIKKAKDTLPQRNTLICAAIISSNAICCFGTKDDTFLRRNIEWLEYATNWAKFNAVASIGAIHSRDVEHATSILSEYLPKGDGTITTSEYTEGGSLYSLGLIASRAYQPETAGYLTTLLETVESPIVLHGASLGLGLCEFGRGEKRLVDVLKGILYGDDNISGSAAGIAIGLIMAGADYSKEVEEMIQELMAFALESAHEKLSHGVFTGIAVICAGLGDRIKKHSETLLKNRNPFSRIGGVLVLASGYSGCYDPEIVKTLLQIASTDPEDGVRRNAAIALGFVMANKQEHLLEILSPLHQNFNSHVRYGSAIAAGIGLAGSGHAKAINRMWELLDDSSDFVRQGAYIGLSMIIAGHTSKTVEYADTLRQRIFSSIKAKYETNVSRFGAIVGQGILDCAGQNGLVALLSHFSKTTTRNTVGLLLFTQYWEWLPFLHFITLSIETRGCLAVDENMNLTSHTLKVDAPPSFFAYFKDSKIEKEKSQNVEMAILSTTARVMARSKEKINMTADDLIEKKEEKEEPCYYKNNQSRITIEEEKYIKNGRSVDGRLCGVFIVEEENTSMELDKSQ